MKMVKKNIQEHAATLDKGTETEDVANLHSPKRTKKITKKPIGKKSRKPWVVFLGS